MPRRTTATKKKTRAMKTSAKTAMHKKSTRSAAKKMKRSLAASASRRPKRTARGTHARRSGFPAQHPDAIVVLKHDHSQLLPLLRELKEITGARRQRLLEQVQEMLQTHTRVEEEIFYPAFRDAALTDEDRKFFHEATEEHRTADMALRELSSASEDEVFSARAKVLHELVQHHAREEEDDMFPRARELFPASELKRLGDEIRSRKQALSQRTGTLSAVAALFSR
jgi:hemerythrin superfamily protein